MKQCFIQAEKIVTAEKDDDTDDFFQLKYNVGFYDGDDLVGTVTVTEVHKLFELQRLWFIDNIVAIDFDQLESPDNGTGDDAEPLDVNEELNNG